MAARTLINVPPKAKRGEVIQIKTLISHIMETGFRHDNVGKPIPRDIITSFVCTYKRRTIFEGRALSGCRGQSVHHLPHRHCRDGIRLHDVRNQALDLDNVAAPGFLRNVNECTCGHQTGSSRQAFARG